MFYDSHCHRYRSQGFYFELRYPMLKGDGRAERRINSFLHSLFCRYISAHIKSGVYETHICNFRVTNDECPFSVLFTVERYGRDGISRLPFSLNFDADGRLVFPSVRKELCKKVKKELALAGARRAYLSRDLFVSDGSVTFFAAAKSRSGRMRNGAASYTLSKEESESIVSAFDGKKRRTVSDPHQAVI